MSNKSTTSNSSGSARADFIPGTIFIGIAAVLALGIAGILGAVRYSPHSSEDITFGGLLIGLGPVDALAAVVLLGGLLRQVVRRNPLPMRVKIVRYVLIGIGLAAAIAPIVVF